MKSLSLRIWMIDALMSKVTMNAEKEAIFFYDFS